MVPAELIKFLFVFLREDAILITIKCKNALK